MAGLWNRLVLESAVSFFRGWSLIRRPAPLPKEKAWQRILIYQNSALGDALFATPAIRAVRQTFPQAHLALLCRDRHAGLMAQNPHLDQLLVYKGKAKSFRPLTKELRAGRFQVAVVLHGNDPETMPLLWAGRVAHIVATEETRFAFLLSGSLPPPKREEHVVDHRLRLVGAIGAEPAGRWLEQPLDRATLDRAREMVETEIPGSGPLVILGPGASSPHKMWPTVRFGRLARELKNNYGARIMILTTAKEAALAQEIMDNTGSTLWATNGQAGILEAAGLIALSDLVVANDSGLYNLGQALKRPTLSLGGPLGPADYGPLPDHGAEMISLKEEVCPLEDCLNTACPDPVCIQAITPELVLEKAGKILTRER